MGCNPRISTAVGIALAFLSWISSLMSFFLPHWVNVDEALVASNTQRIATAEMIQLHYNYGFWKYCSSMTSSTVSSHVCGDIVTHQVWEQIIICMVLLAAILHLSSIITSSLFLLIFDDEPLCLYVAGTSMGVAGMLLLTAVVTYGTENRNIIDVTASFAVPFKTAHLGASFWCAASSCIISFMICILFLVATIKVGSRSIRHGIPLPTRRRYRRHQRRRSLEITPAIRNNSPRGANETVSLYRMPVFNTSSIFDIPRQAAAGATGYGTSQKIDRIGNDKDCCKDVLYSKIRMNENENIKAPRNHDSTSAKYMSDLQNNLNHPLDKPSSSIRYADHSNLRVNEMHENDNNDARSAQIRVYKPSGIPKNEFNNSSYLNECDLLPRDFMNSLERDRNPIVVSSRNVVAQMSSQYVPRYAWTAAAHENKGRSFNFDFQTGS